MLGYTSLVFSWWGLLTLVQVVLAIVFGSVGISKANRGAANKRLAVAGLVLGLVGLVIYFFIGLFSLGIGAGSSKAPPARLRTLGERLRALAIGPASAARRQQTKPSQLNQRSVVDPALRELQTARQKGATINATHIFTLPE